MSFNKQQSFMKQQWFYAVGVGRQPGIYLTWPECEKHVTGIFNAKYKKFKTRPEAEEFVTQHASPRKSPYKPNTPPVTPTHSKQCYSQPIARSSVLEKSRQMSSWAASQPQNGNNKPGPSMSQNIKSEIISDEDDAALLSSPTQPVPPTTTSKTANSRESNEELKRELKLLKNRLKSIEESIHDVIGIQTIQMNKLKQDIALLQAKIVENGNDNTPDLNNTIQRLKVRKVKQECTKPTKRAKLIDENELNGAHSSQESSQSEIKMNFDQDGYCIVYTDGACTNNGRNGAKAGIGVWFGDNHPLNVGNALSNCSPTNNNAEIQAASYAVNVAKVSGIKKLSVHTDSEFVINCVTKWMQGWKRKGWIKADKKPVINKDQLEILDSALEDMEVKWVHVRGHSNIHGNEMADRLANEGAEKYQSS